VLSQALADTIGALVTLTTVQWKNASIADLRRNDYIQTGRFFFHPKLDVSWEYCCTQPGQCKPGESNFEANLPDDNTTISVDSIMSAITDNIRHVEKDAILKKTVNSPALLSYFSTHERL